ncbi:MAG: TRAP transporter substrate-binding protein DctP [Rhizobiaceae bacterium]
MKTRFTKFAGLAALATAAALLSSEAMAEVTLTGVSCLPEGSYFSKRFEKFVGKVNKQGKGIVQIRYLGGAPAIGNPFTVIQKMSKGIYDIGSCSGAYYQNVLPEADAWKMLEKTPAEIRKNGGWAYMEKLHRKVKLLPLARSHFGAPFHLYLGSKHKITKPDLSGLHLRVVPIYTNFFKKMGASTQQASMTEIFILMENGTIGGYGWPVSGLRPGWEKVTKYRVDPGFYDVDIQIMANAKSWDGLPEEARVLLTKLALESEAEAAEIDAKDVAASKVAQAKFGFEVITFNADETEKWSTAARNAGWEGMAETSPKHAKALRKLFSAK